jgi:hypothetical protein
MLRSIAVNENNEYPCLEGDHFILASPHLIPHMARGNPRCQANAVLELDMTIADIEQCPRNAITILTNIGAHPAPVCELHMDVTYPYTRRAIVLRDPRDSNDEGPRVMREVPQDLDLPIRPITSTEYGTGDIASCTTVVEHHPAVDCGICREPFHKMRRLRICGHDIDEECLLLWMNSGQPMSFNCPTCRRSILPGGGFSWTSGPMIDYLTDNW